MLTFSDPRASAEEITSFVEQLAREYFLDVPDRRSEPRYQITLPVRLVTVDDDFQSIGPSLRAVTRDLSASGIGLICQDPLDSNVIVELASPGGRQLRAKAEVLRCKPQGYYFDVGCRFLTDD